MPTKTLKTPSVVGNIFQSPKFRSITKPFIQEPTKASFSRRLESIDAVPDAYKEFFDQIQAAGYDFPHTILTPPNNVYRYRSVEKLVCEFESEIHILEKRGNSFIDQCFPITDINCMEVRTVLLDSSIKLTGMTRNGEPATSIVQFNSVTDYLFTPILKKIRKAEASSNATALRAEMEKFDKWQKSNFKFMNYARNSLLGGERVIHSILQPEIRINRIKVFGLTYYKTISPAHAGILTDRELIMISEEVRHAGDDRYGGIWEYIPLNKVSGLFVHNVGNNMLSLSVQLPHETHLEFLYQISVREDLHKLLFYFKEMNL